MRSVAPQRWDGIGWDEKFERLTAQEILEWTMENFHPRVALVSSFQAEGCVLIDMLWRIQGPDFRVFTLDTARLYQETYDCIDAIRARYGIRVEVFFPDAARVEAMVRQCGMNLFYRSMKLRQLCCSIRKVEPLKRALRSVDAWMTGLRRGQSVTRSEVDKVEIDEGHGDILKINPLADWSHQQVWDYIHKHHIPYNKLYDRGYTSIGCAPCTRPIQAGEDIRAGRWWWESPETRECGLHALSEAKE